MEAQEELVNNKGDHHDDHGHDHDRMVMMRQNMMMMMIKGKRTKRPRAAPAPLLISPPTLTNMASSSSSTGGGGGGGGGCVLTSPTTSSTELTETVDTTEEEEDMANCLILLAQGYHGRRTRSPDPDFQATTAAVAGAINKSGGGGGGGGGGGLYVYQCKTCDRCFPSFQALGGHRASHKKPKTTLSNTDQEKKTLSFHVVVDEDEQLVNASTTATTSTAISLHTSNDTSNNKNSSSNKSKVHECAICGAEFTSGQALGGHMRRHRTASFMNAQTTVTTTTTTTSFTSSTTSASHDQPQELKKIKPRNVLALDLNLPAPDDQDRRETKFPFAAEEQIIVFSASSLVDCHY
ncbi:TFIIH C1-like domain containing protein [Trema orientale]|uniref:TFIIH C1-like domain containing protein n=1 Tax=Trema orientale TaxID=63057 RepID=A0A2P5FVH1_TREOI|nr:TFIIH C1-like domain containing protein [Trema orientale]